MSTDLDRDSNNVHAMLTAHGRDWRWRQDQFSMVQAREAVAHAERLAMTARDSDRRRWLLVAATFTGVLVLVGGVTMLATRSTHGGTAASRGTCLDGFDVTSSSIESTPDGPHISAALTYEGSNACAVGVFGTRVLVSDASGHLLAAATNTTLIGAASRNVIAQQGERLAVSFVWTYLCVDGDAPFSIQLNLANAQGGEQSSHEMRIPKVISKAPPCAQGARTDLGIRFSPNTVSS